MTHADIKPWFRASLRLYALGWLFVIAETVFFLVRDGWHYRPETRAEWLCDMLGAAMTSAGLGVALVCGLVCWITPKK